MFKNSSLRLERAAAHLQAFKVESEAILADSRITTSCRYDKDSGWFVASVSLPDPLIVRIQKYIMPLEIGEYAYQLRAALDGLMWDAITFSQGFEPAADASGVNRIEFPILDGRTKAFKDCAFLKFPFPEKLKSWLETIQPYAAHKPEGHPDRGVSTALGDINDLARIDRHRRLRIVAAMPTGLKFRVLSDPPAKIVARDRIDTCDIFSGKYEFLRFRLETADGKLPEKAALETHLAFEILFEDIEPFEGINTGTQLAMLGGVVDYIIGRFEEEFLRTPQTPLAPPHGI